MSTKRGWNTFTISNITPLNNKHFYRILLLLSGNIIGISESKFDEYVLQLDIKINNYDLFCKNRNRNSGGVAYYIRSDMKYIQKQYFPEEIENIFFEI